MRPAVKIRALHDLLLDAKFHEFSPMLAAVAVYRGAKRGNQQ